MLTTPINNRQKAYLQLHLAVLLFGITAILGKVITLDSIALVWNRLWIAVLALIFIPGALRGLKTINTPSLLRFIGIGIIVALHWITFYGSIKLGNNASVTLACLATTSLFTSILEPIITKSKFKLVELLLGIIVVIGILFLTGVGESFYMAILVGLVSAFLAALFSTLNKKYIGSQNSISVSVIELFSGFLFISVMMPLINSFLPQNSWIPTSNDWIYLIILGVFCTSVAYVLALNSLKELSAFIATLSVNLEPVYGIILAVWLLNEDQDLNLDFYVGTAIILLAVVLHPIITKYQKKRKQLNS